MSTSQSNNDLLSSLLGDVLAADEVTPEQLLQYIEHPEHLSAEVRELIEAQIAASPALADQLCVLNNFNIPQIDDVVAHTPKRAKPSLMIQATEFFNSIFANAWVPAGAMAVIAVSITIAVLIKSNGIPRTQVVDTGSGSIPESTGTKTHTEIPIWEQTAQIAQTDIPNPIDELPDSAANVGEDNKIDDTHKISEPTLMLAMIEPKFVSAYDIGIKTMIRGDGYEVICLAPAIANVLALQPDLYWSLSELPAKAKFLFEMNNETTGEVVISKILKKPETIGLQKISLADMNVTLKTDNVYQWVIIMQSDPGNPALDKFSSATIKRVSGDMAFSKALHSALINNRANVYAANGYWYDALDEVVELNIKYPDNESVQIAYQSLLSQGGFEL